MKSVIKIIIFVLMTSLLSTACTTTEKFTIQSSIDAGVYLPSQPATQYTTVNKGVSTKVEVPSDCFLGYVILKDKQSGLDIPLGISAHHHWRTAPKFLGFAGIVIFPLAPVGLVNVFRMDQLAYSSGFTYDKYQQVALAGLSNKLQRNDPPKRATDTSNTGKRKKATSGESQTESTKTSKAKKKRGNLAGNVIGTYRCSGRLLAGNTTDEEYDNIQIIINLIDSTHVYVNVIESGESFFEEPLKYEVSTNGSNRYRLSMPGMTDATIDISKSGELVFTHKKVNIDDHIYTLSIKGYKQS